MNARLLEKRSVFFFPFTRALSIAQKNEVEGKIIGVMSRKILCWPKNTV
jgi:hypothetical protein